MILRQSYLHGRISYGDIFILNQGPDILPAKRFRLVLYGGVVNILSWVSKIKNIISDGFIENINVIGQRNFASFQFPVVLIMNSN